MFVLHVRIGARGGECWGPRIVRARTREANSRIDRGPPLVFKSNTLRVSTFINVYYHSMDNESPINYHAINGRTKVRGSGGRFHSAPEISSVPSEKPGREIAVATIIIKKRSWRVNVIVNERARAKFRVRASVKLSVERKRGKEEIRNQEDLRLRAVSTGRPHHCQPA